MKWFLIILLILIFTITAGCATVKEVQLTDQIRQLETQIKEQKYKNDELAVKIFQLEQIQTDTTPPPQVAPVASEKPEMAEKKIPQPVAPARPAFKAYIGQQIASGPHVIAIKNASKYIWGSFEINSRPVIFVRNGFSNTYPTDQGIVTLLPPGEVAYLILDSISGSTLIKAKSYTGVATPLKFQRERQKSYNFNARADPYQRSIWSRWDF